MPNLLEITGDDIAQLDDAQLRALIGLLCEADYRKRNTPNWKIQEARQFFDHQALDLSDGDLRIRAVTLNVSLR